MPEKLWPEPVEEVTAALASRQLELELTWWWCRWCLDLAEASVAVPPTRRVAATSAIAGRGRVNPSVFNDSI
jgi:hypothetical protein